MKKFLEWYISKIIKHPGKVAGAAALLTALSTAWLVLYEPLKLDTNFTTLLPDELPCVVEQRRVSEAVGSTDYFLISVESPNPEDNRAFVDDVAVELEKYPEITWVTTKEDKTFFRDRLLLYLDTPDLKDIVDRSEARVKFEKKIANPFYISLDDEEAPDIDFDDIMDKYRERLKKQGVTGIIKEDAKKTGKDGKPKTPPPPGFESDDYLTRPSGRVFTVMARTTKPSTDLDFGRALVAKAKKTIEKCNPHRNPEMRAEVVGSFRNRTREFNSVVSDIFSSLAVSLSLILIIIVVYFRRVRTVALVFVPLIVGMLWTVALTALTLGRLNMVTALIFAVLLGLGIDFGVHLSVRYLDERARKRSLEESLTLALANTGTAILTAGLTTAGALAVLILARFKGFSEFGIIAMTGIIICLFAYALLIPSMAILMEKVSVPKPWRKRQTDISKEMSSAPRSPAVYGAGLAVIAVLTILAAYGATKLEFEYDFGNLSSKKISTTIRYGKTVGQGTSPVVALPPTPEDARVLTRRLTEIAQGDVPHALPLRRAFSLFSFIPDDQPAKVKLLKELQVNVDQALGLKKLKKKTRKRLEDIRVWTEADAFGIDDIPEWVLAKFREKDGTVGRMVYLDFGVPNKLVDQISDFYDAYGEIKMDNGKIVRPTASSFILVEVVRAVQSDGFRMTVVATIVVLILLLIDLRSFPKALMTFLPLLIGLLWAAGLAAALGIKIGLYNMLVLPTLLGIGIDASVHLYHSYREFGSGSVPFTLKTTGVAILIAAGTTAVGFVGMTIVNHDGLRSIGVLAIIGISACLAGALITMPLMLSFFEALKGRAGK